VRPWLVSALAACLLGVACGPGYRNGVVGTVDLGDDFVAPELQLDEDFFFCRIQPEVLTKYSCASGESSDSGGCHDARSALRLIATDAAAPCDANFAVVGQVPDAYRANFEAASFSVQSDPFNSPLYLRPLNRASHPRAIFNQDDPAAKLIADWISGASP
jgi:hypothetical protein